MAGGAPVPGVWQCQTEEGPSLGGESEVREGPHAELQEATAVAAHLRRADSLDRV